MSLDEFMVKASPDLEVPLHLGEYYAALKRLDGGGVRCVAACPPQHGKTTAAMNAIVWHLLRNPKLKIAYVTNAAHLSELHSRHMRRVYTDCGGKFGTMNTIAQWTTPMGGGLLATSVDGQFTGQRADIIVFDDLFKGRAEAENADHREMVDVFVRSTAIPRLWVGGSMVLIGTRWHEDDESGRLVRRGWPYINLQAIATTKDGQERALWPDRKPLEWLRQLRDPGPDCIGDYDWSAMYQGEPRPPQAGVFRFDPRTYRELPNGPMRTMVGCDLAYTPGSHADFFASVVLSECNGLFYVREVDRRQQGILELEQAIGATRLRFPHARWVSYVTGPEKAILQLLFSKGYPVEGMPARWSKVTRAHKCSEAWNQGRILIPENASWVDAFKREIMTFTGGPSDMHDDQVDAMVSAYDGIAGSSTAAPALVGRRRM